MPYGKIQITVFDWKILNQKPSSGGVLKKSALKNLAKFTENHKQWSSVFSKDAGPGISNVTENRTL